MKRSIVIAALLVVLTATSCEKEYNCHCKETYTATGQVGRTWTPRTQKFLSSSKAIEWCYGNETEGYAIKVTCELR